MKKTSPRIPPPLETPADVIVSGHTSTCKRIRVVRTGKSIPVTYSRDMMTNTPGFDWFVSQHYALKTDYPEARARELLTLLELAFPHYVALFGREIPGIDRKRMACIYGTSMETLETAMRDDHMHVFGGGGITQEGFWACYQRPSNEYHCRYILIHECVHLYQYCLEQTTTNTCGSFIEGIADRLSSHVFDPARQRLTVNVLDRAPVHNFLEYGRNVLRKNRKLGFTDFVQGGDRGLNVLITSFLQRTPEALQKWRIYRDEMFRTSTPATRQQTAQRLIQRLYGRPERVWAGFKEWAQTVRPTFFMADWGFDQYGDALVSFGTPRNKRFSQMDIHLVPGRKARAGLHFMDYPVQSRPSIVGPVRRGGREPSVGCVVDFSRAQGKGQAGLGLGRIGIKHFRVLVDSGARLVMDGTDLHGMRRTWALPAPLRRAMQADGARAGLTLTLRRDRILAEVRAGREPSQVFRASLPLTPAQHRRLLQKPMCVLGVGARHLITPFVDDGRPEAPNLKIPAPANPWRFRADHELFLVYRACWRLGNRAPAGLRRLRHELLQAAEAHAPAQQAAAEAFRQHLPAIVREIRHSGAAAELINRVLVELSGITLELSLADGAGSLAARSIVQLRGAVTGAVQGAVRVTAGADNRGSGAPAVHDVALPEGATRAFTQPWRRQADRAPFQVRAACCLRWLGATLDLQARGTADAALPRCWYIGPLDNAGVVEDREHPIEKAAVDLKRVYSGQTGTLVPWRRQERDPELPVDAENQLYFNKLFGQQANFAVAYVAVWVRATRAQDAVLAVGASDGLAAWVNGEKIFTRACRRDWSPREERIAIRLKPGENRLLLKSMHGTGLWFLSPHLEDGEGNPLTGITVLPGPGQEGPTR
ncbi:MAG: hypothetical protein WCI17_03795 [bacterium]